MGFAHFQLFRVHPDDENRNSKPTKKASVWLLGFSFFMIMFQNCAPTPFENIQDSLQKAESGDPLTEEMEDLLNELDQGKSHRKEPKTCRRISAHPRCSYDSKQVKTDEPFLINCPNLGKPEKTCFVICLRSNPKKDEIKNTIILPIAAFESVTKALNGKFSHGFCCYHHQDGNIQTNHKSYDQDSKKKNSKRKPILCD
ncbi:MAG: hypothetical protein NZ480_00270 [Bdellovibrionaceae bacterium]|nr:hypothetical protein [Pseudobdellovibrionaceae bacterium]MDW8190812.1 hypothetical protein [Pseudobdellovibrionaceae bacterium]